MLVKLTPGVNFTNKFTLSFYAHRSQKCKKTDDLTFFFTLLGSMSVKAERKYVGEIEPVLLTLKTID